MGETGKTAGRPGRGRRAWLAGLIRFGGLFGLALIIFAIVLLVLSAKILEKRVA